MPFTGTRKPEYALTIISLLLVPVCPKVFAEPVVTVRTNGDSANRVDIAIVGDGYTASEMGKYANDVETLLVGFFAEEPLLEYRRYFNVHRVDVISNQSGADHPERTPPIERDTAFDATYNCQGIEHLICVDSGGVLTVVSNSLPATHRDMVLVLVNDSQYGGSGGATPVASTHPTMVIVMLHEFGHGFADLADEYFRVDTIYQCRNREPQHPNVTRETNRASIKWNVWIHPNTEIPTRTRLFGIPGLFEGALYCPSGIYRPTFESKMRTLDKPFEQINNEQIVKSIYNFVSPLDFSTPETSDLSIEVGEMSTFSVSTPVPLTHELTVSWFVDDELKGTGQQYTLTSSGSSPRSLRVEAVVEDKTPFVRSDPDEVLVDRRLWNVTVSSVSDGPDLLITSLTGPSTATIGRKVSVTTEILNQGSVDAGPFDLGFFLQTPGTGDLFSLAGCAYDKGLEAGLSSTCTRAVSIPDSIIPGIYLLAIIVDTKDQVAESIEDNNVRLADSGLVTVLSPSTTSPLFVPVLLTSAGRNNSSFTSEITLTNRGTEEALLFYTYTADRGGGSGTATDSLAPGRQRIHSDAIDYLTGLGIPIPDSGNRIGTLRVEVSGSSEVSVVTRTTTDVPEGRAGLAYPGIADTKGFQEAVFLCGLRQNTQDRSNVAFQNMGAPGDGPITLRTTLFSGQAEDTSSRVVGEMTLQPGEFHQYSGLMEGMGSPDQGYVKVEKVEGDPPFYAYGVINDNFNSDGSFVFPVTNSSLVGRRGQTLPVIIETEAFQSELVLTNFSGSNKIIDFSFVAGALGTTDDTTTFSLELKAGEQRILPELVSWLRKKEVGGIGPAGPAFVGALFATPAEGDMSGIVIGARTGSPDGRGGQFSLFYNAVPHGAASLDSAWVYGLQQNAENRSNLALVNTGEFDDSPIILDITIYDGSGESQPKTKSVTLRPRRWTQENGILGNFSQGYVRVRRTSGNNPFVTYGVINDGGRPGQRSGDGAFLLSQE